MNDKLLRRLIQATKYATGIGSIDEEEDIELLLLVLSEYAKEDLSFIRRCATPKMYSEVLLPLYRRLLPEEYFSAVNDNKRQEIEQQITELQKQLEEL